MARINVKTEINGPDEITINLVREDHLEISNTFRIFFEICLAISGAILGSIISLLNDNKVIPKLNILFLLLMVIGCIAFLYLSIKSYKTARCKTK